MTDPPLTTVHQPTYELGATAYELLRTGTEPEQRSFSPHLVRRESTAPPSLGAESAAPTIRSPG
jgi:DNA-binding LacI/PurR family transcriptional regulator